MKIKEILVRLIRFINRILFRLTIDDKSRVYPVNDIFGYRRGTPIDRYYIEQAMKDYSSYIKGTVLEVGGSEYTKKFSKTKKNDSFILNYTQMEGDQIIVGDLSNKHSVEGYKFNTFICTQTLNFIYDFHTAIDTSYELLNHGGYYLGTVASVSNISKYDNSRWGDYWRFTKKGLTTSLEKSNFDVIDIKAYGNVLSAKAIFDGCVVEDFEDITLLDHFDPVYPIIVSFLCRKS